MLLNINTCNERLRLADISMPMLDTAVELHHSRAQDLMDCSLPISPTTQLLLGVLSAKTEGEMLTQFMAKLLLA